MTNIKHLKAKYFSKEKSFIIYVALVAIFFLIYIFSGRISKSLMSFSINFRIHLIVSLLTIFMVLSRGIFSKMWVEYFDNRDDGVIKVIADYILVLQLAVILGWIIGILEFNNFNLDYELITNLFLLCLGLYLIRSVVINVIITYSKEILISLVILYLLGIIDLTKWTQLGIVLSFIKCALDYEKYYQFKKYIGSEVDENREPEVKEKLDLMNFELLVLTGLMYMFLSFTKDLNVTGNLYKKFNGEILLPDIMNRLFMGLDKFILLFIIYLIYLKFLKQYKEEFKKGLIKIIVKIIDCFIS